MTILLAGFHCLTIKSKNEKGRNHSIDKVKNVGWWLMCKQAQLAIFTNKVCAFFFSFFFFHTSSSRLVRAFMFREKLSLCFTQTNYKAVFKILLWEQECISLEHRNIETIITLPNSRTLQLAKHLKLRHLLTYLTASWLHINIRKVKATNFKRAL